MTSEYFKPLSSLLSTSIAPPLTAQQLIQNLTVVSSSSSGEVKDQCDKILHTLEKMSPTAITITLKAIALAQKHGDSLADCLKREFIMTQGAARKHSDFREGVRAVLVDKDRNPQWNPSSVYDLDEELIESVFFDPQNVERELELASWDDIATSSF